MNIIPPAITDPSSWDIMYNNVVEIDNLPWINRDRVIEGLRWAFEILKAIMKKARMEREEKRETERKERWLRSNDIWS